jgi:hypothetical protein
MPPPEGLLAPDQVPMPLQDRVGLEQEHVSVELLPRAGGQPDERGSQDSQGQLLPAREAERVALLALQQAHLVSEHEDLQLLVAALHPPRDEQVNKVCDEMRDHEPEHVTPRNAYHRPTARSAVPVAIIAAREGPRDRDAES